MSPRRPGPDPRTDRFTVRVPREVGRTIRRRAAESGVPATTAASRLLEEAVRIDVEHQHGSLVEAAVERAIRAELSRLADLSFHAALDSDETRRLVIALLVRELGAEQARALRREAHSASWERLKEPVAEQPERSGAWPAAPIRS